VTPSTLWDAAPARRDRAAVRSTVEVTPYDTEIIVAVTEQTLPVVGTAELGPTGPPGPTAVSADVNNYARLGTDNLLHVPIAVGTTPPPAPFVGMLWVDTT
jgi:hypothetical protein